MPGLLSGRTVMITGASRTAGAAAAHALSRAGASVVLAGDDPAAEALAAELNAAGGDAVTVPTDLTSPVSVRRLVEQTLGAFGRLDAVVITTGRTSAGELAETVVRLCVPTGVR